MSSLLNFHKRREMAIQKKEYEKKLVGQLKVLIAPINEGVNEGLRVEAQELKHLMLESISAYPDKYFHPMNVRILIQKRHGIVKKLLSLALGKPKMDDTYQDNYEFAGGVEMGPWMYVKLFYKDHEIVLEIVDHK